MPEPTTGRQDQDMQTALAGEARRRREEALDDPWRLDAKTATEEAFNDEYATGSDVPAHERGPQPVGARLARHQVLRVARAPHRSRDVRGVPCGRAHDTRDRHPGNGGGRRNRSGLGHDVSRRGVHMAPDETGGTENWTVDRAHGNQAESVHGSRQGDGRAPVARLTLAEPARTLWRQVRDTIRAALTDPRTNDRCYELG